jgi:aquaporin Z
MEQAGAAEATDGFSPPQPGWHWAIWSAEFAGTALLVLGALSAVAWVLGDGSPFGSWSTGVRLLLTGVLVGTCFVLIALSPLGRLSGAHLNPAVTLAFFVTRHACRHDLVGYVVAQFLGAFAGGVLFQWLWGDTAQSVGGGVTHPTVSVGAAVLLEAGMTALLVVVLFGFLSSRRLMRWTPLAVGALIAVLVWRVARSTGTSLNPARSEGPAIAFGDLADLWLYFAAPIVGAVAVAAVWRSRVVPAHPITAKVFHDDRYPCTLATGPPPPDGESSRRAR